MTKMIRLNNGVMSPLVGMGTWQMTNPAQDGRALENALEIGYRHFDTAYKYQNEEIVGQAFKKWIDTGNGQRKDLFVVTKLPWIGMRADLVDHFMNLSLKKLQLDYVDLYLVHWPFGLKYKGDETITSTITGTDKLDLDLNTNLIEIWKAMETMVDAGKARSIGMSNFNVNQVERIMKVARIKPVTNQVEAHVYFQQPELFKVCGKYDIKLTAYGPLGSSGRNVGRQEALPILMGDETITEIARSHNKTASQVLLRFLVQHDIIVIPKSSNISRMTENLNVFDFALTDQEMEKIRALDRGEDGRLFREFPSAVTHPEYPFPY